MNYTSAVGLSVHQTVSLIMLAKSLNVIVGQPTTKSMNKMTEQMARMVAPVKMTARGSRHGSLALVLDNTDYKSITKSTTQTTALVTQPDAINQGITNQSTQFETLTHQAETKTLLKEFDLEEAVINIGVQCIKDCIKEQYVQDLNEEYFGYANSTIKSVLHYLWTKWCKIITRERMDATNAFYQAWVPNMTHIITFGRQLNKQQKKCKATNAIISNKAKMLHFFGQMYNSNYFTKEQMTKYIILADLDKVWGKTLTHFMNLYALRKAYGNDRAANRGFKSAAHIQENSLGHSVITTECNLTHDLYDESLEDILAVAQEYVTKEMAAGAVPPPANEQLTLLCNNLVAQRKQFKLVMEQNSKLPVAFSKGGGGGSSGGGKNNGGVANNGGGTHKGGSGGSGGGRGGGGNKNSTFREKKTLPKLQQMGSTFPSGVFLLGSKQKQMPRGMEGKASSLTGAKVPRR